jgi:hypothetical protein
VNPHSLGRGWYGGSSGRGIDKLGRDFVSNNVRL